MCLKLRSDVGEPAEAEIEMVDVIEDERDTSNHR